jgi:hypothetical protein
MLKKLVLVISLASVLAGCVIEERGGPHYFHPPEWHHW